MFVCSIYARHQSGSLECVRVKPHHSSSERDVFTELYACSILRAASEGLLNCKCGTPKRDRMVHKFADSDFGVDIAVCLRLMPLRRVGGRTPNNLRQIFIHCCVQ